MDPGDLARIVLALTGAGTLGRIELALARLSERRAAVTSALPSPADDRLQTPR